MPVNLPLPVPNLAGKTEPQGKNLTEHQQELYAEVLKHFDTEEYRIPGEEDDEAGKLKEVEKFWLSFECLLRFLRAVKWSSADAAIKRLESTLKWRREFGWYDKITAEHVEPENVTGKADIFGFDVHGRPALYLTPSKQNTTESHRQVESTFFMVERLIDLMGPGVETLALMINFGDRGKSPSMNTSRTVLDILQSHYPERLGRALIINIPFIVNMFLKIIMPFVDPITREKIRLNPDVLGEGLFEADQLKKQFGGDVEFEYVHEKYWPELLRMAGEMREKAFEKWKAMGAKVGLKEWEFKGGDELVEKDTSATSVAAQQSTDEKIAAASHEEPLATEIAVAA
ncbi:CRAL TRIO domain-containing protein [Cristinia sonorae]|uniref:CRAL TRIO domain-containing protein n=1 Tax=Cristinia sonorae TaxID=1940300 RepID=A0A8K0UNY7_9AGAR|nr:CRAL TRIO domain-containing protein [Cristinia sonorae]